MNTAVKSTDKYFIAGPSYWPIIGSLALFIAFIGAANWLHQQWIGAVMFFTGLLILFYMMFGWFGEVIHESLTGKHSKQMDRSYRWGMAWFIVSEVCFFGVFFGALFYIRLVTMAELMGQQGYMTTHYMLWSWFEPQNWPVLTNPDNYAFPGAKAAMAAWGLPAINTLILLTSGVTITWAHWGLKLNKRGHLITGLVFTVLLGILFLGLQAFEYTEAYHELGLTLSAGIYGTTFFMLTGFHGAHVTIGTLMLIVILIRSIKGHFTKENHFAFEGVAWYWHFVDVVWLFLFIFVYWL